ncbi:MAG: glycoside hydrolase family 88 protein [bacterium]
MKTNIFIINILLITNTIIFSATTSDIDWIVEITNTHISNNPDPSQINWNWGEGVLMYGIWKTYWHTGKTEYYNYIKNYVDSYVDENGNITAHYNENLWVNTVIPAILLPQLYKTTNDQRYLTAALIVSDYLFNTCPRAANALVHANNDQLWVDTLYMICVFLAKMGELTQEDKYFDFAVNQFLYHSDKLQDPETKLFYHGWDEDGSAKWSDNITHTSPCFWARGNGWAAMTFLEILEVLPDSHPKKQTFINMFQEFIDTIIKYQDSKNGLWFTIIDKTEETDNYQETSASLMFTYSIQKGINNGYLPSEYQSSADLGDQGLQSRISFNRQGKVDIKQISAGTIVGDYDYYVSRYVRSNFYYGVGAALMEKILFRNITSPKKVSNIQIINDEGKLILNWDPVKLDIENKPVFTKEYIILKSSSVTFPHGKTDTISISMDTQYSDSLVTNYIENPNSNIFYTIKAKDMHGMISESSDVYGEYDFQLITTSATDFNEIALPIFSSDSVSAKNLMDEINTINSIALWDVSTQGYKQYVPDLDFSNFYIHRGTPFHANAKNNRLISLLGKVANRTYQLTTTQTTNFNEIMLPLDKTEIKTAAELMEAIPNCDNVAQWNNSIQAYEQYIPGVNQTNFEVKAGLPYHISVIAETIWPENIITKKINPANQYNTVDNGSDAPHTVYGKLSLNESDIRHFTAFIDSRPVEKLDETSPGCSLNNKHWIIQCATFPSKWKADDILNIDFYDIHFNLIKHIEIALTYKPIDSFNIVTTKKSIYQLVQNHPNPFNQITDIEYKISQESHINIKVYNINGKLIKTLTDKYHSAGSHHVKWNAENNNGQVVSSGVYIVQLMSKNSINTKKIILIK